MPHKILIIGNSVAVRVRPPQDAPCNYAHLLRQQYGHEVIDMAMPASMITDLDIADLGVLVQDVDTVIVQFGIVEASARPVPRWLYQFMHRPKEEVMILTRLVQVIALKFESSFRRQLVAMRGGRSWLTFQLFTAHYLDLLRMLTERSSVICLGINYPGERIENQLPGTRARATRFNDGMAQLCLEHQVDWLNTMELIPPEEMPDGIHFNASGHSHIASLINASLT